MNITQRRIIAIRLAIIQSTSMPRVIELSNTDARDHFLKGSSYFNGDFPKYISFEPILQQVAAALQEVIAGVGV